MLDYKFSKKEPEHPYFLRNFFPVNLTQKHFYLSLQTRWFFSSAKYINLELMIEHLMLILQAKSQISVIFESFPILKRKQRKLNFDLRIVLSGWVYGGQPNLRRLFRMLRLPRNVIRLSSRFSSDEIVLQRLTGDQEGIAVIGLNRPKAMNSMSKNLVNLFEDALLDVSLKILGNF